MTTLAAPPTTAPSLIPAPAPSASDQSAQTGYISALMERNFRQRALADLNFHNNAHDGILFTDKNNNVVYANPYFLEMMNISDPAELLNKPLPKYIWGENADQATQLFADVQANGFVRERELMLFNRKLEPVFAMCSSVASKDDSGEFIGTEIMLCNVTSKRRIQAELVERNKQLERVTEFARSTLQILNEQVQAGASGRELSSLLTRLEQELNKTVKS